MRVRLWVSKQHCQDIYEFFSGFRALTKSVKTWKIVSLNAKDVTIESTSTISSLPCKPRWLFTGLGGCEVEIACLNDELSPAQAHALGDLVYLCMTALGRFVAKIEIVP